MNPSTWCLVVIYIGIGAQLILYNRMSNQLQNWIPMGVVLSYEF